MPSELLFGKVVPAAGNSTLNAGSERLKHRNFTYLREARQLGEHPVYQFAKALDRFEEHSRSRSYR